MAGTGFSGCRAFLSPLDYFIVNMALPAIQKLLTQLVPAAITVSCLLCYGLTYALVISNGGRLRISTPEERESILALDCTFLFSSIACTFSPDISMLIAARLFRGLGASLWLHKYWFLFRYCSVVSSSPRRLVFLVQYLVWLQ